MGKYFQIPKPVIVDAVQFRPSKSIPENDKFKIHKTENGYVLVGHFNQMPIKDKDWILTKADNFWVLTPEAFKNDFKKVKEVTKLKVIDV